MDVVDQFYADARAVLSRVPAGEVSDQIWLQATLTKSLVMAGASHFESLLIQWLETALRKRLSVDLANFAANKALRRQYHTFFDWNGNSANGFFGLFGQGFADAMKAALHGNADLTESVRAFLRLGRLRNELAHRDWVAYSLELTLEDAAALYRDASRFADVLQNQLA